MLVPLGGGAALAQNPGNPYALQNPPLTQPGNTKLLQKQRDSAAPRDTQNSSNVQARREPNHTGMTPDTSYSTITTTPPKVGTNSSAPGTPPAVTPSRPTSATDRAQHGVSVQDPTGTTNVPESMRIQQNTVRALPPRQELITKGGSSTPPGVVNSTVEGNRLDSSAPSRQRLQIDDLSARRAQNPNSPSEPTTATNSTTRGAVSGNGTSTGMSGSSVSGTSASPGMIGGSPAAPASRGSSGAASSSAGSS
ncbi:MAG TPA: hypothetical protein VHE81_11740, partial [Lacipirellulaceae bacterium]|nr:hypothetical protein [Lacipirellulaceae bacterium]